MKYLYATTASVLLICAVLPPYELLNAGLLAMGLWHVTMACGARNGR